MQTSWGWATLASIFLGEKKEEGAARVFNAGAVLLALFGVILTAAVLIWCDDLVRLFGAPAASFAYGRDYLFIYAVGSLFVMFSLGLNPFISAQGYSFTSMATVAIGAPGVFYSEGIADIVAGVITATTFFVMLPRILKKRRAYLDLHAGADAAPHI